MTVLVTGGAGYIGSHMVWALKDAGEAVVVVDNLVTGFDWALPGDAPLVRGDVGDVALIGRVLKEYAVDAVIHFAGSIVVPESVADPLKYYRNNTCASRNLIEACVAAGVDKFIFSSTAAVYGDPETVPVAENAPLAPLSPYGTSKLMTELMLRDTANAHPFRYTALRYFNVAGADPDGRTGQSTAGATHLIKVAGEAALGKRSGLSIFGTDYDTPDGTALRDYIHVSDLVAAHKLALDRLRDAGSSLTMNCGYGRGFSVLEVVDTVRRVSGRDFPVRLEGRRPGDSPKVVADPSLIRSELGWRPAYDDLEVIVTHALAWEDKLSKRNRRG
ncbi:UDP-glucose 4-epimerase GalE [Rhizobiales bacterium]|uniref:UDP-glucose 4-epimerase GalE n=1 Tax=Hongsoonwoonella zoysiae TaxID=2821844 RepID=UPI001560A5E5|nr:UDP-glucose 4-epimerase GalE [Hongsoonwoonella zoysiae]NRG18561.1 UDP-glucose 4-epimerase GalE [Hongsoonwoonella zoysiae]